MGFLVEGEERPFWFEGLLEVDSPRRRIDGILHVLGAFHDGLRVHHESPAVWPLDVEVLASNCFSFSASSGFIV